MNRLFRILILSMFFAGLITSVICLACAAPMAKACCRRNTPDTAAEDDSCLSHCLKQKTFAVNLENQKIEEPKGQQQPFKISLEAIQLQTAYPHSKTDLYRFNKSVVKANTGQIWFTPLLNHAPPFFRL